MGGRARIVAYASDEASAKRACTAAFRRIAYLEDVMSDYRPTSELVRLCAKAGGPAARASKELFFVLQKSQELSRRSGGAFDVTVGPLVKLWRNARKSGELPPRDKLDQARKLVGWRNVLLDKTAGKVRLKLAGMQLDLGGIAKGYACDEALRVLKAHGISSAMVEMGGDIAVSDPPPGKKGWQIQIANAPDPAHRMTLLCNAAISSSGDTEQYVDINGTRYSHVVDPRTGLGLTDRIAVTVIAPYGITSDGLSTAVSVLGREKGSALVKTYAGASCYVRRADAQQAGEKGAGMQAYYNWLHACFKGLAGDMPPITRSAEEAARRFVKEDYFISAWGYEAFAYEFYSRAGGLMPVERLRHDEAWPANGIILVAPSQDSLEADLELAARHKTPDSYVILFARKSIADIAAKRGVQFDALVDTHAAEHGGLIKDEVRWVVATDEAATMAALWTWTAEFVAACTRLGKMPPMWQSYSVPGADGRDRKLKGLKFHDACPQPVEPGRLGRAYLTELGKTLDAIYNADRNSIQAIAQTAADAIKNGKRAYIIRQGHALEKPIPRANDASYFTQIIDHDLPPDFRSGDFVLCSGYDAKYQESTFAKTVTAARIAEATVAWTLSTYGETEIPCVNPGDVLVDQRWPLGDAVVTVPGYDVKILPPSGVIGEALYGMVNAELASRAPMR